LYLQWMIAACLSAVSKVRKPRCLHVFYLSIYLHFQLSVFTGNSYYRGGYLKDVFWMHRPPFHMHTNIKVSFSCVESRPQGMGCRSSSSVTHGEQSVSQGGPGFCSPGPLCRFKLQLSDTECKMS